MEIAECCNDFCFSLNKFAFFALNIWIPRIDWRVLVAKVPQQPKYLMYYDL